MNKPPTVLVVDDDETIREVVTITLEGEGYEVLTAAHGGQALKVLQNHLPQVILLDMRMPVMDGWSFSQAYQQLPGPHAPLIVLTAATDASVFAAQVKADAFLAKPFDLDRLIEIVGRYSQP